MDDTEPETFAVECDLCRAWVVLAFPPVRTKVCDHCYLRARSRTGSRGGLRDPDPAWENGVRTLEENR